MVVDTAAVVVLDNLPTSRMVQSMGHHDPRMKRPAAAEEATPTVRRVGFGSLLTAHVATEDDSPQVKAALRFRRRALIAAFAALAVFWFVNEASTPQQENPTIASTTP